jgi:hypothetical protein
VGVIETATGAGRAWHAGNLVLRLQTVALINEQQQKLAAFNAAKGPDTGAAIQWTNAITQSYGLALLALPFAPLQHGNEAVLLRGTILEGMTNGDVTLARDTLQKAQPTSPEARQGPASITVYYPDAGRSGPMDIWCGHVKLGRLRRGGKMTLSLPVGTYWFAFWCCNKRVVPTRLDAETGADQYLSVTSRREEVRPLDLSWIPALSVVPHDVGELQSAETSTSKSEHVLAADKLNMSELQADPHVKRGK